MFKTSVSRNDIMQAIARRAGVPATLEVSPHPQPLDRRMRVPIGLKDIEDVGRAPTSGQLAMKYPHSATAQKLWDTPVTPQEAAINSYALGKSAALRALGIYLP